MDYAPVDSGMPFDSMGGMPPPTGGGFVGGEMMPPMDMQPGFPGQMASGGPPMQPMVPMGGQQMRKPMPAPMMHQRHYPVPQEPTDMRSLVNDIHSNIHDSEYPPQQQQQQQGFTPEDIVPSSGNMLSFSGDIPRKLREPILIIILFVLLNQRSVFQYIGKFITPVQSNINGDLSLMSKAIYGSILAALFSAIKYFTFE